MLRYNRPKSLYIVKYLIRLSRNEDISDFDSISLLSSTTKILPYKEFDQGDFMLEG